MSADRFTEVTQQSWFSRIGGAIKGVVAGVVMFFVAFPLLFWNEGRSVKTYKTLKEGSGIVVTVPADAVNGANDGKLVHLSGRAETAVTLADPVFGVSQAAIKLRRAVEMYQWEEKEKSETRKKLGGGEEKVTTYTYNRTWAAKPIDSSRFKESAGHQNPGGMPYESNEWVAKPVTLGAFFLPPSLVAKIGLNTPVVVSDVSGLSAELQGKALTYNGGYYVGSNPAAPQVGDLRVEFRAAMPTDVSVIAKQVNDTFEPYQTRAGGTIERLQGGVHTAAAMFEKAQKDNVMLTWILRFAGFLVMLIGLNLIFKPLSVVADVVPFIGNLVGAGTGIVAFLLAAACSSTTIAVAWIVYRPLLGILLLALAAGLVVGIGRRFKKGKATSAGAAAA